MKTLKLVCYFVAIAWFFTACTKKSGTDFDSDYSKFRDYITNFSSGVVSTKADILVGLAVAKSEWQENQELDKDYFSVSPSAEGKVLLLQNNTLAFRPAKRLEQDTEYRVTLHLSKFLKVPDSLSDFKFRVKTLKQDFSVMPNDLQSHDRDSQYLNVTLKSADHLDKAVAEKLVTAIQDGKSLPVKLVGQGSNTEFNFIIDDIKRPVSDSNITIKWDGKPYGIDQQGSDEYTIPGKDNFKVISMQAAEGDNQTLLINFSDPVRKDQDFSGLVAVQTVNNPTFSTEGNLLKVYFAEPLNGNFLVEVFPGIESTEGFKTKTRFSEAIVFEQLAPQVRFAKNGTILPASSNLKLNFEAVNLSAVDVRVYRIFESNVMQFLQDNNLNENSYSLRDVALPVAKTKIVLNTNKMLNYGKWNAYALDLSKLIKPEPGAIYHIKMSMRKAYSLYKCDGEDPAAVTTETAEEEEAEPDDFTEYDDNDYYHEDYDWDQRENPCSTSYYYDREVETNVLASDLGVIAKKGENNSFFFAVTSITSTKTVAGASVALYNYQQQKVASGQTDADGIANLSSDKKPYFAIVKKDNNTTYIKLQEGYSLSLSNYPVDGTELQKGLKGFIYGERGVWRPGDTLYLSFILNDKESRLPASHPVKLRLSDPNGKLMHQAVQARNALNHYSFVVPTQSGAPTGNWEAMVSVGGAHFYKSIKIETIKPNRLKIKNSLDGQMLFANKQNNGSLNVAWLHGAVAKGLKVEMQAKFMKQTTAFKNYTNYKFDDPAQSFSNEEVNIYSGVVDDNGNAQISVEPRLQTRAPGLLKAAIITKAYEKGGDFSTDVVSATYSPYDTYVGVRMPQGNKYGMLETGASNRFEVATVFADGRPRPSRRVEVKVYKVEWRWWWDSGNSDVSAYSSAVSNTPVYNQSLTTDGSGKGNFYFKTDKEAWGNYLVRVTDLEGGHSGGGTVLIDYPYWSGRSRATTGEEAAMLMFTTDKEKYAVGEKATVSIPSSEGGRALVSLENGSKVVKTYWAETKKGETQLEIPITPELAPNVYVHVALLQPHASTKNDSPIRLYGIVPIEVVDKTTVLEPQISMPEILRPEQKTTVKVSEKNGHTMTYTIAVVDDGLLDLTRFKTPNAWTSFYAKEALGVKTWDVYDQVIGAYGGKINQVFSIGGDEDMGGGKAKKANRFKPVVLFFGPYKLEKGQTRNHTIQLPKYVGSVRTMVVAADDKTSAYGSVEKTTPVRSALMLLASLPRKLTPSEKVSLPVTVFAMEDKIKNVTLQLKTNKGLKVVGTTSQKMSFTRPDEKVAYFDLEVPSTLGIGKVTISAVSGNERASYDVEMDIVNPNPVTTNFKELVLKPGATASIDWQPFGVAGSNKARLEVSSFPSIDFNRRLDYLIQYPHGCVEQTTSSVFPQLYLADIADVDQTRKSKIQRFVTAAISRLQGFQTGSGGFAYWPGNPEPDEWGSSYAGHFIIEAEKKGYALPLNMKKQWLRYQRNTAREWRYTAGYHNDLAQAYRLYTLALAGQADLSSMNRLRETAGISNESKLRLAAAYALSGQKGVGQQLLAQSVLDETNEYTYYYYGSPERNRAMALETLVVLGEKERAFNLATKLAKQMAGNQWMSTQTTAYCLYSMSKFSQSNGQKGIDVNYTSNGKANALKIAKTFADRVLDVASNNKVTVRNNKQGTLYVKVVYSGVLPVGQEQAEQRGLGTGIVFKDRAGKVINPSELTQGTEFVAEVSVANRGGERVENIALTQIIPSGWEIVNTRFTDFGSFAENQVDYTDIRDDRTNFYFSLKAQESRTFRILLNASYAGTYYLPGVQAEAMYDNNYVARTKGQWVKVTK